MASSNTSEIALDFSPMLKIYKNGHVERIWGTAVLPAGTDPITGVESKDVVISAETSVAARLYLPKTAAQTQIKLPLLVYFHGGGFCVETPYSPIYHNYLNTLTAEANIVAVSVDYRRAPEHPLPIAFEDSWAALKWVGSHFAGTGLEEWLTQHADPNRLFLAGDSAGGTITHQMALRIGTKGLAGLKLRGINLVHPYFWGEDLIGEEKNAEASKKELAEKLWLFLCPETGGCDDPLINPDKDPNLGKLAGEKVFVCVAEKDLLKDRGWFYKEVLEKKGWGGVVEVREDKGEDHVFHLYNPSGEKAMDMMKAFARFMSENN